QHPRGGGAPPSPVGPAPHPVDAYHVIALLTPSKLVLVGLKPPPRTWHRVRRDEDPNMRGCPAWFPSTTLQDGAPPTVDGKSNGKAHGRALQPVTKPILVFSWTRTFHLICVREEKLPPRPGAKELQGTLVLESGGKWRTEADILTSQWLIVQQLAAVTASSIEVSDKGKLFLLGRKELQVGSLLLWADRILAFVRDGDFLATVDLCRAVYTGKATGNKLGLPEEPGAMREFVQLDTNSDDREADDYERRRRPCSEQRTTHFLVNCDGTVLLKTFALLAAPGVGPPRRAHT
ncbi:hypothetical protein AURDEDRAFT_172626, partial [Auricularia subglabra TFB-10046 SS5]